MSQPDYDEIAKLTIKFWTATGSPEHALGDTAYQGRIYGHLVEHTHDDDIVDISIYEQPTAKVEDISSPAYEVALTTAGNSTHGH